MKSFYTKYLDIYSREFMRGIKWIRILLYRDGRCFFEWMKFWEKGVVQNKTNNGSFPEMKKGRFMKT